MVYVPRARIGAGVPLLRTRHRWPVVVRRSARPRPCIDPTRNRSRTRPAKPSRNGNGGLHVCVACLPIEVAVLRYRPLLTLQRAGRASAVIMPQMPVESFRQEKLEIAAHSWRITRRAAPERQWATATSPRSARERTRIASQRSQPATARCRRRPCCEQTGKRHAHRHEHRWSTTGHKPPFALRRLSGKPHGSPVSRRAECGATVSLSLVACRPGHRARRSSLLSARSAWTHAAPAACRTRPIVDPERTLLSVRSAHPGLGASAVSDPSAHRPLALGRAHSLSRSRDPG